MAVFIVARQTRTKGTRYHVRWQEGRGTRQHHLGVFGSIEEAEARQRTAAFELAESCAPHVQRAVERQKRDRVPTRRLRFDILERDAFTCQYCGRSAPDVPIQIDHVVPRSAGGRSTPENLVACCKECNAGKGKRVLSDTSRRSHA